MSTAVLALGGNALARADEPATVANQFRRARESMAAVVPLAREGWRIVIVHGNGPQVGDSLVRNEVARRLVEPLPLGVLVAETAGWIGYMLQQSLQNALAVARLDRGVATLITQTLVDRYDPALATPTKPIGQPLSDEEAERLREGGRAVGRHPHSVNKIRSGQVEILLRDGLGNVPQQGLRLASQKFLNGRVCRCSRHNRSPEVVLRK